MQIQGRRSNACSAEPPHPAEPPNAVTRSRRKYHSGVARICYSVVKVPGAKYLPLYLSNGQKKRGWPTFLARKNFLFVNFLIIHGIRHPKLHFTRFTEHCFSIDFLPLTYNGKDKWLFSRSPEKYIFHLHLFPLPITAFQKRPFGQKSGVLEDIFFENHFTCK